MEAKDKILYAMKDLNYNCAVNAINKLIKSGDMYNEETFKGAIARVKIAKIRDVGNLKFISKDMEEKIKKKLSEMPDETYKNPEEILKEKENEL